MVQRAIHAVENTMQRIHIRGISMRERIDLIREYYSSRGYEDALAKNYSLPGNELLTVSVSLRHALWCEKDKHFLNTHDLKDLPYGQTCPPIRLPSDLRSLQQALRMNIVMGIEIYPGDEAHLSQLLEKQILSPFLIGQMSYFRWLKH